MEAAPATTALNLTDTADARVARARARLPRIGRLPMGMEAKARQARSLAASVCTTGTDVQAPSTAAEMAYNQALLAAIRPKGNNWVNFWSLMDVCVPGHALELDAITQRETLISLRRQVNRDPDLCAKATQPRDAVQHGHGGGRAGRVRRGG